MGWWSREVRGNCGDIQESERETRVWDARTQERGQLPSAAGSGCAPVAVLHIRSGPRHPPRCPYTVTCRRTRRHTHAHVPHPLYLSASLRPFLGHIPHCRSRDIASGAVYRPTGAAGTPRPTAPPETAHSPGTPPPQIHTHTHTSTRYTQTHGRGIQRMVSYNTSAYMWQADALT
jgi:hypothetical protein